MPKKKHRHLLNGFLTGWNRPVGKNGLHDHMVSGRDRVDPNLSGENHRFKDMETGEEI